jgi:Ca2+-binding EF-hand superfamily protein
MAALGLIAALLLAMPAAAQGLPSMARQYMERMDANHDGRVSLDEYQAWMGYGFTAMDRDHDGILAAAELPGGRGKPLTREAHRQRLAAAFARQDRNHDGYLDARELAAPPN